MRRTTTATESASTTDPGNAGIPTSGLVEPRGASGGGIGARRRRSARRAVAALLTVAALTAACGGPGDDLTAAPPRAPEPDGVDQPEVVEPSDDPVPGEAEPRHESATPDVAPGGQDHAPALVARATDHLDVLDGPGAATVSHTLEPTTSFDSPRALLVVDSDGDWLEVLLPVRPNGTTGWIRRDDVEVVEVDVAVEIDLEARELTVLEAGEVVLTTTVAIGDADHPTPVGEFSITDKLDTGDPDGPYGPFALGLSGHSDVLTEFAGGDGQIGIHGTNDPSSIGEAASHGCIRVPNDVVEELVRLLPLGTKVTVS